jgi:hypothetical protein
LGARNQLGEVFHHAHVDHQVLSGRYGDVTVGIEELELEGDAVHKGGAGGYDEQLSGVAGEGLRLAARTEHRAELFHLLLLFGFWRLIRFCVPHSRDVLVMLLGQFCDELRDVEVQRLLHPRGLRGEDDAPAIGNEREGGGTDAA